MDFNEEFALLQGYLLSLENTVGGFKLLTECEGNETKLNKVVDAVKRFIADRGIKLHGKSFDAKETHTLRRMLMFLILNTNLDIKEKLMDDINCGHIVDCAPNLSKEVLVELVDKLSLSNLMCETVIYVPLFLGVELVDSILIKLNSIQPFQALPWIENLARAIYTKYTLFQKISNKCEQSKLFEYFKKLLQYFIGPNPNILTNAGTEELYRYAGFALKSILLLIIDCIKLNLNPSDHFADIPDVYNISLPEYYDRNNRQTVSTLDFIAELLATCKVNCEFITIDIWLFWCECDIEIKGEITKSLQCIIAEAMFDIRDFLIKLNIMNEVPVAKDIVSVFSSMARKPRDEDDEIKEADIELIMKNVLDVTKSQKKWFKALIKQDDIMSDENCITCLENCLELVECDDVEIIIEHSMKVFDSKTTDEYHSRIKSLVLNMIKCLPLDEQVVIVEWYLKKFGINTTLMKLNFQGTVTEFFNKAVKTSNNREMFVSECLLFCIQSPVDIITKVLHEALINAKQISLMINILKYLKQVCNMHYSEDEKPQSLTLVGYVLDKIMHDNLTDVEKSNFVRIVLVTTNLNILNGCMFLRKCLLPALHRSVCTGIWSQVLLWLQTLQIFIDGRVKDAVDIPYCPIMVMLAQVVEESRWNLLTYSALVALVCDEALVAVNTMMVTFLDKKTEEDMEVRWLQCKLEDLKFPLNKSYFSKLWFKFGRDWMLLPYNVDLFLLDVLQSEELIEENKMKVVQLFEHLGSTENKQNALLFSLSKLLPLCTGSEWTVLAGRLKQMETIDVDVSCFQLFSDSVLLLICVLKEEGLLDNDCVLTCLDYNIRNLALIMKEKVIPETTCFQEKLEAFKRMVNILGNLPPACRESCSILVINVLAELMQGMFDERTTGDEVMCHVEDIVAYIGVLDVDHMQILARKIIDCLALHDE